MNKHTKKAIVVAIVALASSLVLWTQIVSRTVYRATESSIDESDETVLEPVTPEIVVKDLQEHFAETSLKASVEFQLQGSALLEAELQDTIVEAQPHASAPDIEQWGLSRVWNISIPSVGIRAPVLLPSMEYWNTRAWDMLEEQMQIGLQYGAVAYPHSVRPGQNGSIIIAGHSSPPTEEARESNFGNLFAALPTIDIGEYIIITNNGNSVTYRIENKEIVSPETTSILEQQNDVSIVKLITCYPVGTTKDRMIITAKKVEE